jgi:hypothetical protein
MKSRGKVFQSVSQANVVSMNASLSSVIQLSMEEDTTVATIEQKTETQTPKVTVQDRKLITTYYDLLLNA